MICPHCGYDSGERKAYCCRASTGQFEDKPQPRPLLIRGIERQRIPSDTGVGDTAERIISKFGGDQFKWVMARLGVNCGCEDRKQYLNRVYPYQ